MKRSEEQYAVALLGGAGPVAGRDYRQTEEHLSALALECEAQLKRGNAALDVVEFAVSELELSGLYVAGRGSAPNSAGYVELDASIMEGSSRDAGAVAALVGFRSPVRVARGVMRDTAHVMLAGAGASAFAKDGGYDTVIDPDTYYVLPVGVTAADLEATSAHGTVGAVARDSSGSLAAATSTGGTFGKLEGRVGDTPLIGPGTWADDDVAVSFTGTGEHIIRSGGAILVATLYKAGASLDEAAAVVLDEIQRLGGDAGVIAVTKSLDISTPYNSDGMKRAFASSRQSLQVATFAAI